METEIISLISNVGFPIAIATYFIFRTEKVIDSNTQALTRVSEVLNNCNKK